MIPVSIDFALQNASSLQETSLGPSTTRVVVTVGLLVALVAAWYAVQRIAQRAQDRYEGRDVETVEMVVLTLLVGLTAAAIIGVWQTVTQIRAQIANLGAQPEFGARVVVSLLIFAVAYGVIRIAGRMLQHSAQGDVPTDHRREVAFRVTQVSLLGVAGIVVLSLWQRSLGNLLLGAGFLGIVIGLAARQTLGAVIAGFVLLFARPFKVGEWVQIGDNEGIVTDVSIINTRLRTLDDEHVLIPNDRVTGRDIVNRSRQGRLRVTVEVGVDYETDVDHAMAVAQAATKDCPRVLASPTPHVVGKGFGDSAVVLEIRFWIAEPSARRMWRARTEVVSAVKSAFEREGITIPFPQRTLGSRGRDDQGAAPERARPTADGGPDSDAGGSDP